MNIYIIGMPLSGKTTIAKALAKKLNLNHIDLDEYIEKTFNISIGSLFKTGNEKTFRELETESLKIISEMDGNVISTGGGIILNEKHKKLMNNPVVLLDIDIKVLNERSKNSYQRPLLQTKSIENLYKERKNLYYEFATIIVNIEDTDKCVNEIVFKLKEEGYL